LVAVDKYDKDFARMRRTVSRTRWVRPVIFSVALILIAWLIYCSSASQGQLQGLATERSAVASLNTSWAERLVSFQTNAQNWLILHGSVLEQRIFESFSVTAFQIASSIGADSALSTIYGVFSNGFLRVSFIFIACWRIWLIAMLIASFQACSKLKPYYADDLLGQTGNGRLYYSGIRAGLDNLDEAGAPDVLVPGLACLRKCSEQELMQSELWQVLNKYNAVNQTNKDLAATIVYYNNYPAYVARSGEEEQLAQTYQGSQLADNAAKILDRVLTVYNDLLGGKKQQRQLQAYTGTQPNKLGLQYKDILPMAFAKKEQEKISSDTYLLNVELALNRVLTSEQKKVLITIPLKTLTTAILAIEAGKPLGIDPAGDTWVRATNFQQLGARAVLHSIPAYPRDYRSFERNMIRQALIYGLRRSVFGAVFLPISITKQSLALRQWCEVLLACPHELPRVTDEVQLFGIAMEVHERWQHAFINAISHGVKDIVEEGFATETGTLFVPASALLAIFDKVADIEEKAHLRELTSKVDSWQHQNLVEGETVPDYERIPRSFSQNEISDIVAIHGLDATRVVEWSYLRYILYHYSWLARRVGDSTVPESYIVFASVHYMDDIIGRNGMVPLRNTRLVELWGHHWKDKFRLGVSPVIVENQDDFERVMSGCVLKKRFEDD